tara:strand:- start:652 stop:1095 length:444 start_codon:yes stop_codon:yes gene_type:complete
MERSTGQFFNEILGNRTRVAKELTNIHDLAWEVTNKEILGLCKLRIAMILGCDSEVDAANQHLNSAKLTDLSQWPTSHQFNDLEKSCLRFTEEFIIDVAGIPDESAFDVQGYLGDGGFVNFVNALLVIEQRIRLLIVWKKLFEEVHV